MNIGIIGTGIVGEALRRYYSNKLHAGELLCTYDIKDSDNSGLLAINDCCNVVFVCVGTPYAGEGKGLDCSAVYDAVDKLQGLKTVIIKSTVNPGVTDEIQAVYPQHKIFFVPEFLSEDSAAQDYASPKRIQVVGVSVPISDSLNDCGYGHEYIDDHIGFALPSSKYRGMPAKQAELLKLATNSFYALKVAFANQMYDLGIEQSTLNVMADDPWIGDSHFGVMHKGYRGFGGPCLIKDLCALIDYARQVHNNSSLLDSASSYNVDLLISQCIEWSIWLGKQPEVTTNA